MTRRDHPVFGDLANWHLWVMRYARKRFRVSTEDAQDLASEVICRMLEHADQYTRDTNLKGWVFTILHNYYYGQRRRDKTFERHQARIAFGSEESGHSPFIDVYLHQCLEILETMPPDMQDAIADHALGYMNKESAYRLGVPAGTIKSRRHRGFAKLAELAA